MVHTLKVKAAWKCGDGLVLPRKQRIWVGGLSGVAYQTMIETLDGFSQDWGWSWGDFTANVIGQWIID
ncbi:MAG: hypothetical protein V9E96_21185 [Chitinophagaceae bacterium]